MINIDINQYGEKSSVIIFFCHITQPYNPMAHGIILVIDNIRCTDKICVCVLEVLIKPVPFLMSGEPIPKRLLPGEDLLPYYTDASNRGYLADPDQVQAARLHLAKKYGYTLPDITTDKLFEMLVQRKDPRQIFFGLSPGWVVNMADKKILKPTDEKVLHYYRS